MPELFNVLPPREARRILEAHLRPLERHEQVLTLAALDRVLAQDYYAPAPLPSFRRSTVDGFAVRATDTYGASEGLPAFFTVTGEVQMGQEATVALGTGQAALTYTGAMVPKDANAVVMVEYTQPVGANTIEVLRPVAPGENVIQVGEDIQEGTLLLPQGHVLRPQDLGGLAALGITSVPVIARPKVALLSSGDEVVSPDRPLLPGQVRDINMTTIAAQVLRAGGDPLPLGIAPDSYPELLYMARAGLAEADMLVISAGSSVSTRDLTARAIAELGEPGVLVHGVALKPGKPTILGVAGGKPVIGLPGNPVSAMVVAELFIVPALAVLSGCRNVPGQRRIRARLTRNLASATGREDYIQARLEERDGEIWADPIFGKSNLISTLIRAGGLIAVPLDKQGLYAGEMVSVWLF